MKNPISWFEIYVDNIQRAKYFYESVLDIKLTDFNNPAISNEIQMKHFPFDMNGYGSTGALVQRKGISAGRNGSIVYFASKDCKIEEIKIEESGGSIYQTKTSIGEHGFTVLAIDTEGNLFGIHSMK